MVSGIKGGWFITERRFPNGVVGFVGAAFQYVLFKGAIGDDAGARVHQMTQELGVDALPKF